MGLLTFELLLACSFTVASAAASDMDISALDDRIRIVGRHVPVDDGIAFDFPGVEITIRVEGASSASIVMSQAGADAKLYQPNHFNVYVDSELHSTFSSQAWMGKGRVSVPLFDGLNASVPHDVTIAKITEAQFNGAHVTPNYVTFWGFQGPPGFTLAQPPDLRGRKIEFIGDSITAGFCNAADPCNDGSDCTAANEHFNVSWPSLICRAFDAQCHVQAWSGRGMAKNCCGQDAVLMSDIWHYTLASEALPGVVSASAPPRSLWDFKSWVPDVLVINLGTNDVVGTGGVTSAPWHFSRYNVTYLSLLTHAISAYGTSTHFVLACGPMTSKYCPAVEWVIDQARASTPGLKISFLDQTSFLDGGSGPACNKHPSVQVDVAMANAAVSHIGDLTNWTVINSIPDLISNGSYGLRATFPLILGSALSAISI